MRGVARLVIAAVCLAALPKVACANTLFSDAFNSASDVNNWNLNTNGLSGYNPLGQIADFGYDYSALGIPAAPGSTDTLGLRLRANVVGGVDSGISVSPTGKNFGSSYVVTFQLWTNYVGSANASGIGDTTDSNGSTQVVGFGVATAGTAGQFAGSVDSVQFGEVVDGNTGSAPDYRVYTPNSGGAPVAAGSGDYAAGTASTATTSTNNYYTSLLPGKQAPTVQQTIFPYDQTQIGTSNAGNTSFGWHTVTLTDTGTQAIWTIDGKTMATVPLSGIALGGGDFSLDQYDTNNGSTDSPELTFALIDNLTVTTLPEPGCVGLLGVVGLGLLGRRRK